jgi:cystathionine beta-lyase family protein involved in aluminum resistance
VFFKEGRRERERAEEEEGRETLAHHFARVFKTDPTLVIYEILEKTLVL